MRLVYDRPDLTARYEIGLPVVLPRIQARAAAAKLVELASIADPHGSPLSEERVREEVAKWVTRQDALDGPWLTADGEPIGIDRLRPIE